MGGELMLQDTSADRGRRVFLVHGRDHSTRDALIALLKAFDLKVIHWRDAAEYAGGGTPYTGDIVAAGMANADAVVVLLTPDDIGYARPHLRESTDGPDEREPTGQARLNVVLEAGMAIARDRHRVVFVEVGQVRKMSDVDGLNVVRMDGSLERRKDLARRLRSAGLSVDTDSEDWRAAGSFISGRLISPSDGIEVNHQVTVTGMITGLHQGTQALIIVHSPRSGFWPQAELKPNPDGRFSSKATFGGNEESYGGKDYILMIALASHAAGASLRASKHPVSSLPSDVRVLDQATVIRRMSDRGVSTQSAAVTGKITRPRGGRVNQRDTVTGVVASIPSDSQALLLVQTPRALLYYPQAKLLLNQEGGFTSEAKFGRVGSRDGGEEFVLILVLASPTASATFQACLERGDCMASLPPDVLVLDQVTVIRNEGQELDN
jgi:predicted nucleotide-binding protein